MNPILQRSRYSSNDYKTVWIEINELDVRTLKNNRIEYSHYRFPIDVVFYDVYSIVGDIQLDGMDTTLVAIF